ncbi:MAG TPA: helix-turn-helix domain-containing protein, partial [Nevskiales bacterium]|nr:helix-turn-helix domain-containing protein [Nevskiales bacterium]
MSAADAAQAAAEAQRSAVSPGELLRRARESLNLTISDLAGQTRLSRAVLEALENNDFANLAMPVYVRGYFRKCAHVLNLPEERLLQAYADWTGTPLKPQPLPVTVSVPPREYASARRTPSWRYVLIIAVVIGAVLWW